VEAYRRAAEYARGARRPLAEVLEQGGLPALVALPTIGHAIARLIRDLVETGRSGMLDRLRGESDAVSVLATVAGIGPVMAERLHRELGIESLEEFDVAELLEVDREYREGAERGTLRRIAPRRFNPTGEAWLPVLHATRGDRHYTALFSNTARAHQLGRTRDWVVIYADGRDTEHQWTVVTVARGPFRGRRIVRGREGECYDLYRARAARRGRVPVPPGDES
jgi:putative hydrolase